MQFIHEIALMLMKLLLLPIIIVVKLILKLRKLTLWLHHMKFVVAVFKNLNKATMSTLKPFLFHGQSVHQYINGY